MVYIGIDPGRSGAMAILWDDGKSPLVVPFGESGALYKTTLSALDPGGARCCLERVGPMPGQGVTSMFKFGENYGFIQGLLTAYAIPFELVTPQRWKKEFGVTRDKNTSIAVCRRLFPDVSLRRTNRSRKDDDGMAEALLMAEYARRRL